MIDLKLNLEQSVRWQSVRRSNAQLSCIRVLSSEIARLGIVMVALEEVEQVFPKDEFWDELDARGWSYRKDAFLGVAQIWASLGRIN